jgi:hypothetical protein
MLCTLITFSVSFTPLALTHQCNCDSATMHSCSCAPHSQERSNLRSQTRVKQYVHLDVLHRGDSCRNRGQTLTLVLHVFALDRPYHDCDEPHRILLSEIIEDCESVSCQKIVFHAWTTARRPAHHHTPRHRRPGAPVARGVHEAQCMGESR